MPRGQYERHKGGGAATATARAFAKEPAEAIPQAQRSLLSCKSLVGTQE